MSLDQSSDACDLSLSEALWHRLDQLTKPRRSLGRLETLAHRLGLIQGTLEPRIVSPQLLIFAADHGIAEEGVSLYPQSVSCEMVANFLRGGAAASVLARLYDVAVTVIDAGLVRPVVPWSKPVSGWIVDPIARGTANFLKGPAMTPEQFEAALDLGRRVIQSLPCESNTILLGEMGIGNSSSAAALLKALSGSHLESCVGRGTGVTDAGWQHKVQVLERALARRVHGPEEDPRVLGAEYGGFEIVALTGAAIAAAEGRRTIVVDGFMTTVALLLAERLRPGVVQCALYAHRSREPGHRLALERLRGEPILDLDLALGEGTGALLLLPILRAAAQIITDMATFDSARVSREVMDR